jgi:hypothetical protein
MQPPPRQRSRALAGVDAAIALISVLVIMQMWLLSATLESYLAGYHAAALPGALVSGALLAGTVGLYLFIRRLDIDA